MLQIKEPRAEKGRTKRKEKDRISENEEDVRLVIGAVKAANTKVEIQHRDEHRWIQRRLVSERRNE